MDRPRGRASGGRARGKPADQQNFPQQRQPPPQAAAPPPQGAWANRGRGNVGAPGAAGGPPPVDNITQRMGTMSVAAAGPGPSSGDVAHSRGGADNGGRGAIRQRPLEELATVFRPAHLTDKQGTKGRAIELKSNYFRLLNTVDLAGYLYRVDFNPDPDVTVIKKALLRPHKDRFGAIFIFDGTVLYTKERFKELELVSMRTDNTPVQIKIKHTTDVAPGDPSSLHHLNNVMRTCLELMGLNMVSRHYYDASQKIMLQQHNLEVWQGIDPSFRQCENEVLLNAEVTSKIMRLETAYAFLQEAKRESADWQDIFMNGIIGTTVITRFNNKTYRVDDVDFGSNPSSTFELKNQEKISFRDYYRNKYQIDIKYNDQPLLISNPSAREIRQKGAKAKPLSLIPELCCLTGLTDRMRANRNLMTALADYTKLDPNVRIQRIEEGFMKRLMNDRKAKEELQKWKLSFEPSIVKFTGRVLEPEPIIMGNGKRVEVDPRTGDFTRALVQAKAPFLNCEPLKSWAVIFTRRMSDHDIMAFVQTLVRSAQTFHFRIEQPHLEQINDDKGNTYAQAIEKCYNDGVDLVMCVVPNDRKDRYDAIKRKCYIQRSIPNQVVLMRNVSKNVMAVGTKVSTQMACKIGGSPWAVHIPLKGTMIVGFDVCHDTNSKLQSHGALVATVNDQFTRYASFVNPHEKSNELSNYMGANMLKAVSMFAKHNNKQAPAKIIFYRDGVGEGNLIHTKEHEVGAIKDALAQVYGSRDKVPLTFIVVSKRISTRIFAKGGNAPPGTVVDNTITLPVWYDFFLVSQSVARGTVAPTSYNVLYDANNLKPDVVQQLSYRLCHLYYNWSGALRVPAPCQYAHKLAFLVGQHLHAPPSENMNTYLYFL